MLGYRLQRDLHCPVILCDACGEPIFEHGNVYWVLPIGETQTTAVWHTHKGKCARFDEVIKEVTGKRALWEELSWFIKQVNNNTLVDPQVTTGVGG